MSAQAGIDVAAAKKRRARYVQSYVSRQLDALGAAGQSERVRDGLMLEARMKWGHLHPAEQRAIWAEMGRA